ncbi:hypothetical protein CWI77_04195 [Pseudidiomarina planktonica]|nr:hypothetical protein CWI77_04195 [Pseudidiomarina planktonica]
MLVLGFSLVLASCGFQLRDDYQLPASLQQAKLSAPQFSEFAKVMRERLVLAGVELVEKDSPVTIRINNDQLDRRTLSLSASGQVAEYELIYRVRYELLQEQREPQQFELEVYRDYQDDPNFALAKTREREILVGEMREEAARRVLRQLIAELTETPSR